MVPSFYDPGYRRYPRSPFAGNRVSENPIHRKVVRALVHSLSLLRIGLPLSNLAIETLHISVPPMAGNPLYPLLGGLRGVGEECLLRGLRLPGFAERVPLQFQGL